LVVGAGGLLSEKWIEGIGSFFGPLQSGLSVLMDGSDAHDSGCMPTLLCQKTGTTLSYINPQFNSCYSATASVYSVYGCLPVGIHKQSVKNKIAISPNPTSGIITIEWNNETSMNASSVILTDIVGGLCKFTQTNSTNYSVINFSELKKGIYFLQIVDSGKLLLSEKIIKD